MQRRVGIRGLLALTGVLAAATPCPAAISDKFLVEGLVDGEAWNTGEQSLLVSRNAGEPAAQGRLRLWAAAQLTDSLQGMLLGRFDRGRANDYFATEDTHTELDEAWIRYTHSGTHQFVAQAGRMTQPIGNYSRRYLSSSNPLIGSPANYAIDYPYAISLSGTAGFMDFLVAVTDQPLARQVYLPVPDSSPRPSLAAGITPFVGLRVGSFVTWGPYLASEVETDLAQGQRWRDYQQRVVGIDLQFSRGHFELNGEMTRSFYEMPGQNDERGLVYYIEPKYTWSPRWFTAVRVQRNQETQVWLPDAFVPNWYVTDEDSWDVEAGVGFRIDPRTLLKLAYRVDRSTEDPSNAPMYDHAIAFQVSCGFDVRSFFERPQ